MNRRRLALAAPLMFLAFGAVPVPAQAADPAGPVRRLYSAYGVGDAGDPKGRPRQDPAATHSRPLLALYRRAEKAGLDFDFFVQGQDFSLAKPIDIVEVATHGETASVVADLTSNFIEAGRQVHVPSGQGRRPLAHRRGRAWRPISAPGVAKHDQEPRLRFVTLSPTQSQLQTVSVLTGLR